MEDIPSVIEKLKLLVKNNLLVVALLSLGLMFLSIGLIQLFSQEKASVEFKSAEDIRGESAQNKKIFVDVSGEVLKPGVYSLSEDARLQDALVAAGGLSGNADRQYIAQYVNLAQKVTDGMKIYVPHVSQGLKTALINNGTTSISGFISINQATMAELDKLSGVGPVTAQKIIDARPYGSLSELVVKKAVSSSVFEKIKDKISL